MAWCTKSGYGTRLIPDGTLTGVHFTKAANYVQVVALGDFTKINILAGDEGGELDPHGADGNGNPEGGLVYTNAFGLANGQPQQVHQWMSFISSGTACFRACLGGTDEYQQQLCQHIYDVMGCVSGNALFFCSRALSLTRNFFFFNDRTGSCHPPNTTTSASTAATLTTATLLVSTTTLPAHGTRATLLAPPALLPHTTRPRRRTAPRSHPSRTASQSPLLLLPLPPLAQAAPARPCLQAAPCLAQAEVEAPPACPSPLLPARLPRVPLRPSRPSARRPTLQPVATAPRSPSARWPLRRSLPSRCLSKSARRDHHALAASLLSALRHSRGKKP